MHSDGRGKKGGAMKQTRVLVVDDDPEIVALLKEILAMDGFMVTTAYGEAALLAAEHERPAVILLDVMMPGMDGMTVARHLHANPTTAMIPIVTMTAGTQGPQSMARMGAQAFLPKPFMIGDLLQTVAAYR